MRGLCLLIIRPFLICLNLLKIRLVYLDESRIGHLFGDTLALIANYDISNHFIIFPVEKPCSNFLVHKYNKQLKIINSKILKILTAWLRNESLVVLNMTNSLNYVYEKNIISREIVIKPIYTASEINYRNIFSISDELEAKKYIIDKYKIQNKNFCFFNLRSLTHDKKKNKNHQFRNLNSSESYLLIECLVKRNFHVVNASDYFHKSENVINLREYSDFDIDDIIKSVLGCEFYIGDSTGTSVMAQIAKKPSFLYNIFPTNFEITNDLTEAVYVTVVNEDKKVDTEQINTWQYSYQFEENNIHLKAIPFNEYEFKFNNWVEKFKA